MRALIFRCSVILAQVADRDTLRLDPDVLDAFRREGAGWQSRINQILRNNMPKPPA